MKRWRSLALALALAAGFTAGLMYLFGAEFAAGSVYPEYSSLRADPAGAKLLYESLAQLPGVHVTRNFLPLDLLPKQGATVMLLADNPLELGLPSIEKLASGGNRVVIAFPPKLKYTSKQRREFHAWNVRFDVEAAAVAAALAGAEIAEEPRAIAEASGWKELDHAGGKLVAIEKPFGKGSVALFLRSDDFSNDAVIIGGKLPAVTAALGANTRIVFDDSHLGIVESGSIVGLVRRFRLTGFALGLAICATLFIWRNATAFPPPAPSAKHARRVTRTSVSGLQTLLHKHINADGLTAACWREWIASNRSAFPADKIARAESIAAALGSQPIEAARQIHAVLYPTAEQLKGEL